MRGVGSSIETAARPTNVWQSPYFIPAAATVIPAGAGLSYYLMRKYLQQKQKDTTSSEMENVSNNIDKALESEYRDSKGLDKAGELGKMLDVLAERQFQGKLFSDEMIKEAATPVDEARIQSWKDEYYGKSAPPGTVSPNALNELLIANRAAPMPNTVPSQGKIGPYIAALLTGGLGLGYLGYNFSRKAFDKSDPARARAKAIKDALRYHMQIHQPRVVVSPLSKEELRENPEENKILTDEVPPEE